MNPAADTRYSLLLRVRDPADGPAWGEFCTLYEPVVYRMARRFGLQDADARDLMQEVLAAVAGAIQSWEPDPSRGRFRTWLYTIVRNKTIAAMRRRRPGDRGTGDSATMRSLQAKPVAADEAFELEVRRAAFHSAAEQVRQEVHPSTWEAFWQTSVCCRPIDEVARELRLSAGSVYAARSRVLARLRREIEEMLDGADKR
jgi:RNA polymerase sigma factor (sigma-70 family)